MKWFRICTPSGVALATAMLSALAAGASAPVSTNKPAAGGKFTGSASCRECHEKFYELWSTSFHGLALQPYTAELARARLTPQREPIVAGKFKFLADIEKGVVVEEGPGGREEFKITQATGGKNVFYFLTPLDRGWLQVLPVAFDVRRKEWLDTTASAVRHFGDRRDEALYWKERPLTFNTSCYGCHVSQLDKNYDLATDTYRTTWAEPGINCETCHGPGEEHVKLFRSLPADAPPPQDVRLIATSRLAPKQRNDMCAPCHAKMSPVTDQFKPGDDYFDHFDLVALENADFYPDGRDLGENYTFTQWRMSPCVKSGKMDCLHCHTSSGRYRFHDPVKANDACLPCHKERVENAPAHTHHKTDSRGNQCISCHMPMTEFARMRRTDHSMRPPVPAASIRYKSPNACNICHTTNNAAWADTLVREWRQRDYQRPILERASLIDAARKEDWSKLPQILAYLGDPSRDEVHTVSLVRLLANCPKPEKWPAIRMLLDDPSPFVRSSAADVLAQRLEEGNLPYAAKAAGDVSRLVRVRAASGLAAVPDERLPAEHAPRIRAAVAEFVASLRSRPDDMASRYNLGNFYMGRGEMAVAIREFELANRLQPDAMPPYVNASLAYNALGQNDKAEASLRRALALEPTNAAVHLNLGMLLAELNKVEEAEQSFRCAFKSDPRSAQAAYNLAILVSGRNLREAVEWSQKAATLSPDNDRYVYTLAFFQHRNGETKGAVATLEKMIQPGTANPEAYLLLGRIYEDQKEKRKAVNLYRRASEDRKLDVSAREQFRAMTRSLDVGGGV